jgi:hypothetical protein
MYVEQQERLFGHTATLYGLEEEAYRRLAACQRSSKDIFPHSHDLLLAHRGTAFFEALLASFFELRKPTTHVRSLGILEPFDGYIVGPMIREFATQSLCDVKWICSVLDYDWAIWHARRVAKGWPPLTSSAPLTDGASLISADFDLKSMLREIKRLNSCNVATEVYPSRICPGRGSYHAAVYPDPDGIRIATLDRDSFQELQRAISEQRSIQRKELCDAIEHIGLVVNSSFLCCSHEAISPEKLEAGLPKFIEPAPH